MKNAPWGSFVVDPLKSARERLAGVLPPQPDKILQALQHVERALQYAEIEEGADHVLTVARNALRALNSIDRPRELPPKVSVAVSTAIGAIVRAVRTVETQRKSSTSAGNASATGDKAQGVEDDDIPVLSEDDTVDLLACAEDLFYEAHGCPDDAPHHPRVTR